MRGIEITFSEKRLYTRTVEKGYQPMQEMYEKIIDKKIVSIDIFDTLLFRCFEKPSDLFEKVALLAKEQGYLSTDWNPCDFKLIRIEAERNIYQAGEEPTLENIYSNISIPNADLKRIQELEIHVECDNCFANPLILEFVEYVRDRKIPVVLTTDMYLSKEQIIQMLKVCDISVEWFDEIFVSSEYCASKREGSLYDIVLDRYGIMPEQMLHIGDNSQSDIHMANQKGIDTFHYSNQNYGSTSLVMDHVMIPNILPQLYSLRKWMTSMVKEEDQEKRRWMLFGMNTMGPFFTYATEWVLDVLEREHIGTIYPLMREGELYQFLLEEALHYREKPVSVKLFYSSRNSMFLNHFETIHEQDIIDTYKKCCKEEVNVIGLFRLFQIEQNFPECFDRIRESFLKELIDTDKQNLLEYLCKESSLTEIQNNILKSKQNTKRYIESMGMNRGRFATLDFGYKATTQTFIEDMLRQEYPETRERSALHLLFLQSKDAVKNIQRGFDIRGYVSMGEYENTVFSGGCRDGILEALQMRGSGCTIGYDVMGYPVMMDVEGIDENQFECIRYIHEGILLFQRLYLKYFKKYNGLSQVKKKSSELYKLLCRSVLFPTKEEADMLSSLYHEDTFGNMLVTKVMSYEDCVNKEWDTLYHLKYDGKYRVWHPGIFVQKNPLYYVERQAAVNGGKGEENLVKAVMSAKQEGICKAVIAGAGLAGDRVYHYCSLAGIEVMAFTDANRKLHGTKKYGVPVCGIAQLVNPSDIIIASIPYRKEIEKEIQMEHGTEVRIY